VYVRTIRYTVICTKISNRRLVVVVAVSFERRTQIPVCIPLFSGHYCCRHCVPAFTYIYAHVCAVAAAQRVWCLYIYSPIDSPVSVVSIDTFTAIHPAIFPSYLLHIIMYLCNYSGKGCCLTCTPRCEKAPLCAQVPVRQTNLSPPNVHPSFPFFLHQPLRHYFSCYSSSLFSSSGYHSR
jgi:hypothetical protein